MKTSDNRPAIRFTGCTDAWHHCQFNDIVITHPTKQFIKEPSLDGTIEVIQQGNEPVVGYANGSPFDEYASVTVFGDHTVSIYKPKKPFFVATDGTKILSGNNIEGNFFYFLLERYKPIPEGYKRHFTILIEQECNFPKSDEQKHIAQYMLYLDDLIERNKRKYEKLVNLKKAMLDKMFPKNGELVPEVRFAGFSGNWERRKLGDMAEFKRGLTYNPSDVVTHGVRVLRSSNIDGDTFVLSDDDVFVKPSAANIPIVQKGDILITAANGSSKLVGKHAMIDYMNGKMVHGGFMLLAHPHKHSSYVNALISAPWYADFIQTYIAGGNGAIGNLKMSDLSTQTVCVCSDEEQEKIGDCFSNLNGLIALQHHKLERLQCLKNAFLDKMFV